MRKNNKDLVGYENDYLKNFLDINNKLDKQLKKEFKRDLKKVIYCIAVIMPTFFGFAFNLSFTPILAFGGLVGLLCFMIKELKDEQLLKDIGSGRSSLCYLEKMKEISREHEKELTKKIGNYIENKEVTRDVFLAESNVLKDKSNIIKYSKADVIQGQNKEYTEVDIDERAYNILVNVLFDYTNDYHIERMYQYYLEMIMADAEHYAKQNGTNLVSYMEIINSLFKVLGKFNINKENIEKLIIKYSDEIKAYYYDIGKGQFKKGGIR